jgi:hypothetical protein
VPNLLAAAGAFLVGRGTSHLFLLRRAGKRWPSALAWFGLLAALGGPELWDSEWVRAAKGVERVLRTSGDSGSLMNADLSWTEYEWLSRVFEGPHAFSDVPKLQSRTLSIEVVPGAAVQLRLVGNSASSNNSDSERYQLNQLTSRVRELEGALENFVILATKTRPVLEREPLNIARGQVTFHFDDSASANSGDTRRKNSKR